MFKNMKHDDDVFNIIFYTNVTSSLSYHLLTCCIQCYKLQHDVMSDDDVLRCVITRIFIIVA